MKNKLKKIIKETDNELKRYVAKYWLDSIENYQGTDNANIKSWYLDLMQVGCQSGFISELIYYHDTKAFYIKYLEEIEELQDEYQEMTGEELDTKSTPRYNFLAWFAFEETARKIAEELGLEV